MLMQLHDMSLLQYMYGIYMHAARPVELLAVCLQWMGALVLLTLSAVGNWTLVILTDRRIVSLQFMNCAHRLPLCLR